MVSGLNFTGVASRRKLSRGLGFAIEVVKLAITLLLITAGLSVALWTFLGVNPLKELFR